MTMRIFLILFILLSNIDICYAGGCCSCCKKKKSGEHQPLVKKTIRSAPSIQTDEEKGDGISDITVDFEAVAKGRYGATTSILPAKAEEPGEIEREDEVDKSSDSGKQRFLKQLTFSGTSSVLDARPCATRADTLCVPFDFKTYSEKLFALVRTPYNRNTLRILMSTPKQYAQVRMVLSEGSSSSITQTELALYDQPVSFGKLLEGKELHKHYEYLDLDNFLLYAQPMLVHLQDCVRSGTDLQQATMKGHIIDYISILTVMANRIKLIKDTSTGKELETEFHVYALKNATGKTDNIYMWIVFTMEDKIHNKKHYIECGMRVWMDFQDNRAGLELIRPGIFTRALTM